MKRKMQNQIAILKLKYLWITCELINNFGKWNKP